MNICMEKEYSLNKNTSIILKKDSCQLLANDRALSTFYAVKMSSLNAYYAKAHLCVCVSVCVCERERERDFAINQQINKTDH